MEKKISVVCPDKYADIARKLVHVISKQKDYKAVFLSIKKYKENEFQISGKQYVIFIGNKEENELTSSYLDEIDLLHDAGGVCYGFDGSRALIYGTGEDKEELADVFKESASLFAKGGAVAAVGYVIGYGSIVGALFAWPIIIVVTAGAAGYYILTKYLKSMDIEKLIREQTKLGITKFIADCFEDWTSAEI